MPALRQRQAAPQPQKLHSVGVRAQAHGDPSVLLSAAVGSCAVRPPPYVRAGLASARLQVLLDLRGLDPLELGQRQDLEQLPPERQRLFDGAVLVAALAHVAVLEHVGELEERLVLRRQRRLAEDDRELLRLLAARVGGEELVRQVRVVLARPPLADALVPQARQRREHVDRRVDALPVQRAVEDDLALGDVAGEVGDRMRLVVVGHGDDRDLRDRAALALDAAGALVERREVGVEIARDSRAVPGPPCAPPRSRAAPRSSS